MMSRAIPFCTATNPIVPGGLSSSIIPRICASRRTCKPAMALDKWLRPDSESTSSPSHHAARCRATTASKYTLARTPTFLQLWRPYFLAPSRTARPSSPITGADRVDQGTLLTPTASFGLVSLVSRAVSFRVSLVSRAVSFRVGSFDFVFDVSELLVLSQLMELHVLPLF